MERAGVKTVMAVAVMQLVLSVSLLIALARLVVAAALWLLEEEEEELETELLRHESSIEAWRRGLLERRSEVGGFDKKKMLQPHFGQTFKFKRVGVK
ncbi:hypothetical protein GUITHDRAFT_118367 [Guillardia theta CCMP2712]|uniref:Uncharacterized protein n=1 Tax=Guillardia theta (strain CCMP2712) TaxID=905079 RepID=L1IGR5_GUITC|nr:hypothetical protein GUITHDRAFT_118367 [Guillardia theta CCMP2712]EKX35451.1 hypothetical protein GUITHDRAFT_118367 [Guillardia theta CCMP2712]|eukprot:XP_005822431.1 hypothetical protein GUITHDRAFT_118367 [Guillardia theta CCMP2712]